LILGNEEAEQAGVGGDAGEQAHAGRLMMVLTVPSGLTAMTLYRCF
jgi:hypothetical protein